MLKRFKKFLEKNNFSDVELLRIRAAAEQFESTNKLAYGTIRSHIANLIDWSKYSDEQLIELALEADCFCFNLISSKLSLDNMSNEDKIQLGKKVGYGIDNHYVWSKIAESLELQGYSNLTLIKLGKLASNDRVWERVAQALSLDKLTNAQLMRLAFVAYNHKVTNAIKQNLKLKSLSLSELVEVGKGGGKGCRRETYWKPVTEEVLSRRLSIKKIIAFGKLAGSSQVWEVIIKAKAKRLSVKRLLEIGVGADRSDTWRRIAPFLKLGKRSNSKLIEICNIADDYDLRRQIFEKLKLKGLSSDKMIELGKQSNDWSIWHKILPSVI